MMSESNGGYRSAELLVAALTGLFVLYLLLTGVALWSGGLEVSLISDAMAGLEITEEEALMNDARQAFVGLSQIALLLITAVTFCFWIHRANANARALAGRELRFTPGWAVGWFFVPIMNLFRPCQVVQEIWQASDPAAGPGEEGAGSQLVLLWWGAWIAAGAVGRVSVRFSMRAEEIDEILNASYFTMASDAMLIPLSILALLVVRGVHDRQERRQHRIASGALRPAAESIDIPVRFRPIG